MGNMAKRLFLSILISGLVFGLFVFSANAQPPDDNPRKIVVFQDNFVNEAEHEAIVKNLGGSIVKHLRLINGMAAHLPPGAEKALLKRSEVSRIDEDLVIYAVEQPEVLGKAGSGPKPPSQPNQVIPWGISTIGAVNLTTKGTAIKVAIMDTGIDLSHSDLAANIKGNANMINPARSGDDDNGHGTHVAGTVAALDNKIGVVGVGPAIYLYAVKVLDKNGKGWLSDLVEGLDWCINNRMQVVNMSLGTSSDNLSFSTAIHRTYQAGIIQVAAAGNNGATTGLVDYPGKYYETIAVSAVGQNNGSLYFASFSSYGPEVDLTAPGVSINSTYKGGYYKVLNGTSMATPHVTGVAALVLAAKGPKTPDDMKTYLQSKAVPVPGLNSNQQGAGLVRADLAVQP